MFTLPDKQVILADLETWQTQQFAPLDGELGLAQLDEIALQVQKDIDEYSLQMYVDSEPRHHLGASVIGNQCSRYIWMHFRWVLEEIVKPRMARLWHRGHREEPVIIQQLRGIGFTIKDITENGEQIKIARDSADGHFGGSLDALAMLPTRYGLPQFWILLEMKTVGSKYFKDMLNLGVFKAREQYYRQMCVYAYKLSQQGTYGLITHALFYAVNKDTDEVDIEFIKLDHKLGQEEVEKAEAIAKQYYPPLRLSENASDFRCKMCMMHRLCHLNEPYRKNCRSCRFAEPVAQGQWQCHHHNAIIPKEFLIKGCESWESLPR